MTNHGSASDEPRVWRIGLPILLAAVMTAQNALKPPCIDDTAYLAVARQIAEDPFNPYGFQQFWYDVPQNANEILAPPVFPYWLGLGIRLFGEQIVLLKLWLFPIAILLSFAVRELLHRFARGVESPALVGMILSPWILPGFNFMLDVPAIALALTALCIFLRALDRDSWFLALAAGVVAGLAAETKYTAAIMSPVMLIAGVLRGRWPKAIAAMACAGGIFVGWELYTRYLYGESHFLFALADQSDTGFLHKLSWMPQVTITLIGGLGPPLVFLALAALKWRWLMRLSILLSAITIAVIAINPDDRTSYWIPLPERHGNALGSLIEGAWGWGLFAACAIAAGRLIIRGRWHHLRIRVTRPVALLSLWLLIEWLGYYVMTPFPGARRLLGVLFVTNLILARVASRTCMDHAGRRRLAWSVAAGASFALLFAGIDIADSRMEPDAIRSADEFIHEHDAHARVWYTGHWGLQYSAERSGFRALIPGHSVLEAGDWLVVAPRTMARQEFQSEESLGSPARIVIVDRGLRLRTLPPYYGGAHPMQWWPSPMFELRIYRIRSSWHPRPAAPPSA